jgi:septum formation protein
MPSSKRLILASQSSARKRLLARLRVDFETIPADIDEAAVARKIRQPRRLVAVLAKMKAQAVADGREGRFVIGSDQVLVCGGRVFGKPLTRARAQSQLRAVSGRSISLLTAVCVIDPAGEQTSWVHETKMKFRKLTTREIADYVSLDQPLECSGSFKFESYGIGLFESVQTDDPTAIEGLPLLSLHGVLLRLGYHSRYE